MIIHRYLFAHYKQVAVYYWPILFWALWRIDRWSAETGRQAFVQVDRYGRAWVPYFEGMGRNYFTHDLETRFYAPGDVADLCPQVFERAIAQRAEEDLESARAGTIRSHVFKGAIRPRVLACASICGVKVHLDPG